MIGPFAIWPHVVLMEWALKKYSRGAYQTRLLTGMAAWEYTRAHSDASYKSSRRMLLQRVRDGGIHAEKDNRNDRVMRFIPVDPKLCLMVDMALALDQEKSR